MSTTTLKKEEKPLQNAYDSFKAQLELDKVSAQNEISNANKVSKQYMDNYLKYYGMQGSGMGQSAYANLAAQNTQNIANVNSQYSKQLSDYRTAFNQNLQSQAANDLQTLSKEDQQSYIDNLRGQSGVNDDTISNIQSQANAINYQRDEEQAAKTELENKQTNATYLQQGTNYAYNMTDEQWNTYIEGLKANPNITAETIATLENERSIYSENKRLEDEEEATTKAEEDKKQANNEAMSTGSKYAFTMTDENWNAYMERLANDPNITDETLYHLQEQREIYLEDERRRTEEETTAKTEKEKQTANNNALTLGSEYAYKMSDEQWDAYIERLANDPNITDETLYLLQNERDIYLESERRLDEKDAETKTETDKQQANSEAWTYGQSYAEVYDDQQWESYINRLIAEGVDERVITNLNDYREAYAFNTFENSYDKALSTVTGMIDAAEQNKDYDKIGELNIIFTEIQNATTQAELNAALDKLEKAETGSHGSKSASELGATSGTGSQNNPYIFNKTLGELKDMAKEGELPNGIWVQYKNGAGNWIIRQVQDGKLKEREKVDYQPQSSQKSSTQSGGGHNQPLTTNNQFMKHTLKM